MKGELRFETEMEIPGGKRQIARGIIDRYISKKRKKNPAYPAFAKVLDRMVVSFRLRTKDVDFVEDEVEPLARALIEGMKSDAPFVFPWAYLTHLGGGAFVIMRGLETFWIIPLIIAEDWIRDRMEDQMCAKFIMMREIERKVRGCLPAANRLYHCDPKECKNLSEVKDLLERAADILKKARSDAFFKEKDAFFKEKADG